MADLFTLWGKIAIDAADSQETIDKITGSAENLGKKLNQASTSADNAGSQMNNKSKLGTGAVYLGNLMSGVTEAAVKFAMKLPGAAVTAAASVAAEQAAFESTFGAMADEATKRYQQIGNETNILETRLRTTGTKGYAQLKGAGVETNEALSGSEKLLRLSADAAAYYDISLEAANERLRSFMRGNTEAGDAIGLFTSEGQRNEAAIDAYGQKWTGLNEAQRQFLMLDTAEKIYKDAGVIGQAAREGEEWANVTANMTEAQTQSLATIGAPIKEALLPALNELSTWLANAETQAKLSEFAGVLGNISGMVFDGLTTAFDWMMNNGEAVGVGLGFITAALTAGLAVAHPYAAAVAVIAAAIMAFASAEETPVNSFSEYTQEEIELLNQYHEAVKKAQQAREEYANADGFDKAALWDAKSLADANASDISAKIMARPNGNEMMRSYNDWFSSQENPLQASVTLAASEGSEGELQSAVDGYELEGEALIEADPRSKSVLQAALNAMNLTVPVTAQITGTEGIPGFATGLERVPYDNMLAYLHKDEMVLTAAEAAVYRREKGVFNGNARKVSKANTNMDQPITVNLTVNGVNSNPYEIASEVKNALEILRWQG